MSLERGRYINVAIPHNPKLTIDITPIYEQPLLGEFETYYPKCMRGWRKEVYMGKE